MGAQQIMTLIMDEGTPNGTMKIDLATWDCSMYRIKRSDLHNYINDATLKSCGIYFLIGKNDNCTSIYVGQANARNNGKGILGRVIEHEKPTEAYWDEAFLIYSSSNSLYATELNYLERTLWEKLQTSGMTIMNASKPALGNCSPITKVTMDRFIEGIEKMMGVFYKDFLKSPTVGNGYAVNPSQPGKQFFIKRSGKAAGRDIDAVCEIQNSKFVVLKGSLIATAPRNVTNSKKYNHDTYAAFIDANGKTTQDIPFDSPSGASAFVIYGSSDGKVDWKDSQKQPMKNFMP